MIAEIPFILPVLILTGIASHDTYTTKLWQDGANNGFNSAPNQIVYALTNGRTYNVPIVWSSVYVTSLGRSLESKITDYISECTTTTLSSVFSAPLSF